MRSAIALLTIAAVVHGSALAAEDQPTTRNQAGGGDAVLSTTIASRAIQPGEVIVLTVVSLRPLDDVQVRAFERSVPAFGVGERKWQVLVGIDVDVRPGRYTVRVEARASSDTYRDTITLPVRARKFSTRRLRVDPSFVTPPPEAQPRIAEEARLLSALWQTSTASRFWDGAFVRPVPGGSSSRFGALSVFNDQPRGRHNGEDLAGPEGTPVAAPNAGRVALAQDLYFSGNTVVIDHGLGLFSLLAHLSAIDVKQGDSVTAGQQVGRLGATGRVTGPHLHWAVRLNGARIDPISLLATLGKAK